MDVDMEFQASFRFWKNVFFDSSGGQAISNRGVRSLLPIRP
jgi:hypothetical protein